MSKIKISAQELSNETKKQKQEIINRLKNIDEFLQYLPNPEPTEYVSNFQYLNEKEVSPEQLLSNAKNSLNSFAVKEKSKIEQDYLDSIKENEKTKVNLENEYLANKNDVKKHAEQSMAKANENAISKGLGRSSIRTEKLQDIEDDLRAEYDILGEDMSAKLSLLKREENDLMKKRDTALSNFEIEYAVKLQDKIDELASEITAYNNKVIEYNNKLRETEEKRKKAHEDAYLKEVEKNEKRNENITKFLNKYGYGSYNAFVQNQKMDAITEFVDSLDKDMALEIMLEDESIKDLIGEENFNKILTRIKERSN